MRDHQHVRQLGHVNDFSGNGKAAATREIRLQDVDFALFNQLPETPFGGLLLSAGDARFHCFRYLAVPIVIFGVQELFHQVRGKRLERSHHLNRFFRGSLDKPSRIDQQVATRT